MSEESQEMPGLHIDDDWKAQAQAEKQRLAEETGGEKSDENAENKIPPANFQTLLSSVVTQALLYMGAIPDPMSGQRMVHLELSKHHIDLLAVLEEKTKGNLEEEEAQMLTQTLHELRANFVELTKQVAEHMKNQPAGGAPIAQGTKGPNPGGLVMP